MGYGLGTGCGTVIALMAVTHDPAHWGYFALGIALVLVSMLLAWMDCS